MINMYEHINDLMHGFMLAFFFTFALFFLRRSPLKDIPTRVRKTCGGMMLVLMLQILFYSIISFPYFDGSPMRDEELEALFDLTAVPPGVFLLMELTRFCEVKYRTIFLHLGTLCALVGLHGLLLFQGMEDEAHLVFLGTIAGLIIYMVFYGSVLFLAGRRFNRELPNVYADLEGRQINWLNPIFAMLLIIAILDILMNIFFNELATQVAYQLVSVIIWLALNRRIVNMRCTDGVLPYLSAQKAPKTTEVVHEEANREDMAAFIERLDYTCMQQKLFCRESLTREDVAKVMHVTPEEITQTIKEVLGLTIAEYISRLRSRHAAYLLSNTDEDVSTIYLECGYRTEAAFVAAFRAQYQCSPKEYREWVK